MIPNASVKPVPVSESDRVGQLLWHGGDAPLILTLNGRKNGNPAPHDALNLKPYAGLVDVEAETVLSLGVTRFERDEAYPYPEFKIQAFGADAVDGSETGKTEISQRDLEKALEKETTRLVTTPSEWATEEDSSMLASGTHTGVMSLSDATSAFADSHGAATGVVKTVTVDGESVVQAVKTVEGVFDLETYAVTSLTGHDPTLLHPKTVEIDGEVYVKTMTGYPGPIYVDAVDTFIRKLEIGQYIPAELPETGEQVQNFELPEVCSA